MEDISSEEVPSSACAREHTATPEQVVDMTHQIQTMMHDVVKVPQSADRDVIVYCIQNGDIHCLLSEIRVTLTHMSAKIVRNTVTNVITHHLHNILQHLKQQLEEQYQTCNEPDTRWLTKWIHPRIDSHHMLSTVNIIKQRYTRLLAAVSGSCGDLEDESCTSHHIDSNEKQENQDLEDIEL